ncbi:unnamed protein product, partial [Mycena citricolor]
ITYTGSNSHEQTTSTYQLVASNHPLISLWGKVSNPIVMACCERVVSEEALYMELLAAKHDNEAPDAGALEGSGDEYAP